MEKKRQKEWRKKKAKESENEAKIKVERQVTRNPILQERRGRVERGAKLPLTHIHITY